MRLINYTLLVFVFCITSCYDNRSIPNAHFDSSVSLVGKVLPYEVISDYPSQLDIIDSTLLLFRPDAMTALRALNITNGVQYDLLHTGRGPDEYLSPFLVDKNIVDRSMKIYDVTYKKMSYLEWDESSGKDSLVFSKRNERSYSGEIQIWSTIPLDNGYMVSMSIGGTEGVLLVLDKDFNVVSSFCNPLNIDSTDDWTPYTGQFASYGNTVIYTMMQLGYILCFDIGDEGEIKKRWEYFIADPVYEEFPAFRPNRNRNPMGFFDIKVTERFVYALYSGKPLDNSPDFSGHPRSILVFDLDGRPITKLELDDSFVRIAITPDDSKIYGFSLSGEVICYDLEDSMMQPNQIK